MNYHSLEEYFIKLQNRLFLILLTPLLSFIYLLAGSPPAFDTPPDTKKYAITAVVVTIAFAHWFVMTLAFRHTVGKISPVVGLSLKLDKYYWATILRFAGNGVSCLALVAGFYLTNSPILMGAFTVAIVLFFFAWPLPAKVCSDLKLKGDEKEMVYYKKHKF